MPRYTTSQTYTDGNTQIVALQQDSDLQLAVVAAPSEGAAPPKSENEDLEIKLRRILEQVPVRISNTSGSSAGSGSGDFHQEGTRPLCVKKGKVRKVHTLDGRSQCPEATIYEHDSDEGRRSKIRTTDFIEMQFWGLFQGWPGFKGH